MLNHNSLLFASRFFCFFCFVASFQIFFYLNFDYYFTPDSSYLNIPDHMFYEGVVTGFGLVPDISSLNNYVISIVYSLLYALGVNDLVFASLCINIFILSLAYCRVELLCFQVANRFMPIWCWLGLLSVLQFSILINKDSFGVLFYVVLVAFLCFRKKSDLVLLLILCPIRLQFFLVLSFAIYLAGFATVKKTKLVVVSKVIFLYVLCSMVALYLERNESLLAHSYYSEGGVASWISKLNSQYYVGSFLLNVLKPIQYVYDLYRSANVDSSLLGWIVYFSRLYLVLIICILVVRFCKSVYLPWAFLSRGKEFAASVVICSFFLVYTISPIVDYRYLMNIGPVLMLLFAMRQVKAAARVSSLTGKNPETLPTV